MPEHPHRIQKIINDAMNAAFNHFLRLPDGSPERLAAEQEYVTGVRYIQGQGIDVGRDHRKKSERSEKHLGGMGWENAKTTDPAWAKEAVHDFRNPSTIIRRRNLENISKALGIETPEVEEVFGYNLRNFGKQMKFLDEELKSFEKLNSATTKDKTALREVGGRLNRIAGKVISRALDPIPTVQHFDPEQLLDRSYVTKYVHDALTQFYSAGEIKNKFGINVHEIGNQVAHLARGGVFYDDEIARLAYQPFHTDKRVKSMVSGVVVDFKDVPPEELEQTKKYIEDQEEKRKELFQVKKKEKELTQAKAKNEREVKQGVYEGLFGYPEPTEEEKKASYKEALAGESVFDTTAIERNTPKEPTPHEISTAYKEAQAYREKMIEIAQQEERAKAAGPLNVTGLLKIMERGNAEHREQARLALETIRENYIDNKISNEDNRQKAMSAEAGADTIRSSRKASFKQGVDFTLDDFEYIRRRKQATALALDEMNGIEAYQIVNKSISEERVNQSIKGRKNQIERELGQVSLTQTENSKRLSEPLVNQYAAEDVKNHLKQWKNRQLPGIKEEFAQERQEAAKELIELRRSRKEEAEKLIQDREAHGQSISEAEKKEIRRQARQSLTKDARTTRAMHADMQELVHRLGDEISNYTPDLASIQKRAVEETGKRLAKTQEDLAKIVKDQFRIDDVNTIPLEELAAKVGVDLKEFKNIPEGAVRANLIRELEARAKDRYIRDEMKKARDQKLAEEFGEQAIQDNLYVEGYIFNKGAGKYEKHYVLPEDRTHYYTLDEMEKDFGKSHKGFAFTKAGREAEEAAQKKLSLYRQDARVLRAIQRDINTSFSSTKGKAITLENTFRALKESVRHKGAIQEFGLTADTTLTPGQLYGFLSGFLGKHTEEKYDLPGNIPSDKYAISRLSVHVRKNLEMYSQHYHAADIDYLNGREGAVRFDEEGKLLPEYLDENGNLIPEIREARRKGFDLQLTPYGKEMQKLKEAKGEREKLKEMRAIFRDTEREVEFVDSMGNMPRREEATNEEHEQAVREKGGGLLPPEGKQIENDDEYTQWIQDWWDKRKAETGVEGYVNTPNQQIQYAVERELYQDNRPAQILDAIMYAKPLRGEDNKVIMEHVIDKYGIGHDIEKTEEAKSNPVKHYESFVGDRELSAKEIEALPSYLQIGMTKANNPIHVRGGKMERSILSSEQLENVQKWANFAKQNPDLLITKRAGGGEAGDLVGRRIIPGSINMLTGVGKVERSHIVIKDSKIKLHVEAPHTDLTFDQMLDKVEDHMWKHLNAEGMAGPSDKQTELWKAGEIIEVKLNDEMKGLLAGTEHAEKGFIELNRGNVYNYIYNDLSEYVGGNKMAQWIKDGLTDRASWLMKLKENPQSFDDVINHVFLALHEDSRRSYNFEELEKDDFFKKTMERIRKGNRKNLSQNIAGWVEGAMQRQVVGMTLKNFFEVTKAPGANNVQADLLLKLATNFEGQTGRKPEKTEIIRALRASETAIESTGHLRGFVSFAEREWDNVVNERRYQGEASVEAFESAHLNEGSLPIEARIRKEMENVASHIGVIDDSLHERLDQRFSGEAFEQAAREKITQQRLTNIQRKRPEIKSIDELPEKRRRRVYNGIEEELQKIYGGESKRAKEKGISGLRAMIDFVDRDLREGYYAHLSKEEYGYANETAISILRAAVEQKDFFHTAEEAIAAFKKGGMSGIMDSLKEKIFDPKTNFLRPGSAHHIQALAPFLEMGFKIKGRAEVDGKDRGVELRLGNNGEVTLFELDRKRHHAIVDRGGEAIDEHDMATRLDFDTIRKEIVEDNRSIEHKFGELPVILNQPNVRTNSRAFKGYIAQTPGETLMHANSVKEGGRFVSMDLETTLLPNQRADMNHLLEVSMREYHWNDKAQKVVAGETRNFLVKPSAEITAQLAEVTQRAQSELADRVNTHFALGMEAGSSLSTVTSRINQIVGNKKLTADERNDFKRRFNEFLSSDEDLSYLRNIAKYSQSGRDWTNFKGIAGSRNGRPLYTMPDNLTDWAEKLGEDAKKGHDFLAENGTMGFHQAIDEIHNFIGDDIVLAQNGTRAEKVWMDMFNQRVAEENLSHSKSEVARSREALTQLGIREQDINDFLNPPLEGGEEHLTQQLSRKHLLAAKAGITATDYGRDPEAAKAAAYSHLENLANQQEFQQAAEHIEPREFNPRMIELMHMSRGHKDAPGLLHNMDAQVARMFGEESGVTKWFREKAHFAEHDTDMTARLFEGYMQHFDGFTPEMLKEGDQVVKVYNKSNDLTRGLYTVAGYDSENSILKLYKHDAKGMKTNELVQYHTGSQNEMNALFQDNFKVLTSEEIEEGTGKNYINTFDWDNARRGIEESTSYGRFMNEKIKHQAAVDEKTRETNVAAQKLQEMTKGAAGRYTNGETLSDTDRVLLMNREKIMETNPEFSTTELQRAAAPHGKEYWNSVEADLTENALSRIQDLTNLGAIDQKEATKLARQLRSGFEKVGEETGVSRGKRTIAGVIDVGRLDASALRHEGERLTLQAHSEGILIDSMLHAVGRLMDGVPGKNRDAKRSYVIDNILVPHLERAGLYEGASIGTDDGERLEQIANKVYKKAKESGRLSTEVDEIKPIINEGNQKQAEALIDQLVGEKERNLSPMQASIYERMRSTRAAVEEATGGVGLSRLNYDLGPKADMEADFTLSNTWREKLQGKSARDIYEMTKGDITPEEHKELYKQLHDYALGQGTNGDRGLEKEAQDLLNWNDPDMRKQVLGVGKYYDAPMGLIKNDYLQYISDLPDYIHQDARKRINNYFLWQRDNPEIEITNPDTDEELNQARNTAWNRGSSNPGVGRNTVDYNQVRDKIEENKRAALDEMNQRMERERVPVNPEGFIERGAAREALEDTGRGVKSLLRGAGKGTLGAAGLALAGMYILGNFLNDPTPEKRPDGGSPDIDGNYSGAPESPRANMGQRTARVEERGRGMDGLSVRVRGKAPGHMNNDQIAQMTGEGIRGAVPMETNVNVNSRDDTSSIDGGWLKNQFMSLMKGGFTQ